MDSCCFCLGDDTEIPPFGSISDAKALIKPCTTCSLLCHKKCLLDWFNTIPSDKLKIINGVRQAEYIGVGAPPINQTIEINLSPQIIQQWLNNLVEENPVNIKSDRIYIFAPCPQCKKQIVFKMDKNSVLTIYSSGKTIITRIVQYGGVFLGLTSALTGILSMGYIGLTTAGLKIMDCIIPNSLLIKLLTKKSNLIFNIYSIDNLEQALMKGLVDPLKFSRIPILPIVMFRLRSSSIFRCFFPEKEDNSIQNWINELMISGYISSFSDHKLIRELMRGRLSLDTSNLISTLIPLRWIYDLIYRLTFNRVYFNYTMKVRPRAIANSLSEDEILKLENLNNEIEQTKSWKLKLIQNLKYTLICLKNDYSMTISYGSTIIKCFTTLCWPYISSKVGLLIIPLLKNLPKDKKILVANIIGLFLVAIVKEFFNLYLTKLKVSQMSQLSTLTDEELTIFKQVTENLEEIVPEVEFPGAYP
ncbi:unnamed protein product [Candida verbasci]|uniref:Uncharacterized protein n=1 Tax=Candida verbasci TaxID=1227364 RepID=A0A9W4TTU9_9ASCO|nr:unnamed protein product [Candida verbasci]